MMSGGLEHNRLMRSRQVTAVVALVAVVALDVVGWRYSPTFESLLWAPISGTFGFAIVVVAWAWPKRSGPAKPEPLSHQLVSFSFDQWHTETIIRGMNNPDPLSLEWKSAKYVAVDSQFKPMNLAGELIPHAQGNRGVSAVNDITMTFKRASGRLVLLGAPGSGKTAIAVHLITSITGATHPSPAALLPLSSWHCEKQSFHEWVLSRLADDYPLVPEEGKTRNQMTEQLKHLIKSGKFVLVLDGLDELPTELRSKALRRLNEQLDSERILMTCRSAEYRKVGGALSKAAVIEIQPLKHGKVRDYLESVSNTSGRAQDWKPVLTELASNPTGPLARALQTPLMVWLARTVFSETAEPPSYLVARDEYGRRLFRTPAAIENYLLDRVISATYAKSMVDGLPYRRVSQRSAQRWLTFLAVHLANLDTYDLALWHLHRSMNKMSKFLVYGCAFGIAIGLPGTLLYNLKFGLSFGLTTGISAGSAAAYAGPAEPPYGERIEESSLEKYRSGISFTVGLWFASGLAATTSLGLHAGLLIWGWEAVAAAAAGGLTVLLSMTKIDTQNKQASTPEIVLCLSRRVTGIWALIFGALLGLGMRASEGIYAAVVAALIGVLGAVLANAWGGFAATRGYFAVRRQLPWRLMRFLAEAHQRGILRQVGAIYQFRHATIQDRLVAQARVGKSKPLNGPTVTPMGAQPSPSPPSHGPHRQDATP